jgi:Integrase core domain
VNDAFRRCLLCTQGLAQPDHARCRAQLERVLLIRLAARDRSDNGPPFAATGVGGLTRLGVWCVKLGITPERIACKPEQNGRHERMHKTVKAETATPPAANLAQQQQRFDCFRHEFNHERPHEALGQIAPAQHYAPQSGSLHGFSRGSRLPFAVEVSPKIPGRGDLRAGCLNFIELSAISVANIAPTLTAVLIMPLMYGAAGNGSWLAYMFGAVMLLFVALNLNQFARRSAATGSMHTYTVMGLGETAGGISAWCLVWAYLFDGIPGVAGFTIFGNAVLSAFGLHAPTLLMFAIVMFTVWLLGKLCTGGCAERLAESGHDNRVQRMEVE